MSNIFICSFILKEEKDQTEATTHVSANRNSQKPSIEINKNNYTIEKVKRLTIKV